VTVLTGCGGTAKSIAYRDVSAQLRPAEFTRQVREIFRTRASLVDYLERAMPGRRLHLPRIDFSRRQAVLIAAGPRSSTGYVLRVLGVRETPHTITVTVHEVTPRLGEPVRAGVTYPYRVIAIPRIDKKLFVHWPGR
jgi:PrcB C-terminal